MVISRTEKARLRVELRNIYKALVNDPKNPVLIRRHNEITDILIQSALDEKSAKWRAF